MSAISFVSFLTGIRRCEWGAEVFAPALESRGDIFMPGIAGEADLFGADFDGVFACFGDWIPPIPGMAPMARLAESA
jgi:hypothetical protein